MSRVVLLWILLCSAAGFSRAANDATTLQAAVDSLAQQVTSNNARISALQADFNAKISALESSRNAKIAALESDLAKARTAVAFHAEFSEDDVTLGRSSPLVLDNAVTNVGSGYDAHTGNFKAPVSGSYMFVFRFMPDYSATTYLYLMVDNVRKDNALSYGGSTWDSVGASVVLHLRAGQRVWLQSDSRGSKYYRGGHYTTFSGFLIRADH